MIRDTYLSYFRFQVHLEIFSAFFDKVAPTLLSVSLQATMLQIPEVVTQLRDRSLGLGEIPIVEIAGTRVLCFDFWKEFDRLAQEQYVLQTFQAKQISKVQSGSSDIESETPALLKQIQEALDKLPRCAINTEGLEHALYSDIRRNFEFYLRTCVPISNGFEEHVLNSD